MSPAAQANGEQPTSNLWGVTTACALAIGAVQGVMILLFKVGCDERARTETAARLCDTGRGGAFLVLAVPVLIVVAGGYLAVRGRSPWRLGVSVAIALAVGIAGSGVLLDRIDG